MKSTPPKNVAHSVRDRLLKLAKARGEEFNFVLLRYALERFLCRLGQSSHADEFVLKGAMLFTVWSKHPHRATKDLDLLGFGAPGIERLVAVFREVSALCVEDDGVAFDAGSVKAKRIKEDAEYEGVRITLEGKIGSARIAIQVDVGFGDAVTPPPAMVNFPTLLPFPAPKIRAYSRETVVAEKLHAMVSLGMANTRMKDFFDVWFLSREFAFQGQPLVDAIRSTFDRRDTTIPRMSPVALTGTFALDATKGIQWSAFLERSRVVVSGGDCAAGGRGNHRAVSNACTSGGCGRCTNAIPMGTRWAVDY
jgi:predicted nucleotidyltransferase component of viral defense system